MNNIRTQWFESAKCACPLNEHPMPQFERENWFCLNGEYDFEITSLTSSAPQKYSHTILVPFAPESELSGIKTAITENDLMWYRRKVTLPSSFESKRIILHFTAVDWKSEIFINGKSVLKHTGGYNPFEFDITDYIDFPSFELMVKVFDPTDKGHGQRGKQVQKPFGFWYTATSGIWQTVWCEAVEENHIKSVKLTPDIDNSVINIKTDIVGSGELHAKIFDNNNCIFDSVISQDANIKLDNQKLWSPENPFLYNLNLELINGTQSDKIKSYFGMRKFSVIRDSKNILRLGLNNKPYFQKGLLDQGYWPESQLTAPTDEAMIFDIKQCKDLGFNMLRKHIKREPYRWYYHCDRLGMIVWQDMISGGKALNLIYAGLLPNLNINVSDKNYKIFNRDKKDWRDEFKDEMFEMISDLYNHPSIACWVPFNEGWGQFDAKEIGDCIKKVDPSRFVDHASGWHDQNGSDFKSIHKYVFPVTYPKEKTIHNRPVILSEYGGYQNRVNNNCWSDDASFGLYLKFKDKNSLTKAYEKLHINQIIPLISKGLSATVYTQVSDVECELNGMFTYDRKVLKLEKQVLIDINNKLTLEE